MAATESTMVPLGTPAPGFELPDPTSGGRMITRDDFRSAPALVIMFLCNHCPFVKHLRSAIASLAREYQAKGVAFVGISSNDVSTHPADSPELMAVEARDAGYTFSYLYDETQAVARAYGAACTPDFFVYDRSRRLVYRGQFDDSRPATRSNPAGTGKVTGADLRGAIDAVLAGRPAPAIQRPSLGCNIKWKPGNEPA